MPVNMQNMYTTAEACEVRCVQLKEMTWRAHMPVSTPTGYFYPKPSYSKDRKLQLCTGCGKYWSRSLNMCPQCDR